jgi:ABC-type branched-subunit amino acid transport system ATPase component
VADSAEAVAVSPGRGGAEVVLALEDVSVRFGGVTALAGVSVTVPARCAVGVIGPNGAGKTTLLNVASGLVRPSEGRITLGGTDVTAMSATKRAVAGIGRTFQTPRLFPGLTVAENLKVVDRRRRRQQLFTAAEALAVTGVPDLENVPAERLQAGQRRFVELARSLMLSPAMVLLDEPATGLRDAEVATLTRCLTGLVETEAISLLVISHDMRVINEACQHVVVLDRGQVLAEGSPQAVRNDPAVIEPRSLRLA